MKKVQLTFKEVHDKYYEWIVRKLDSCKPEELLVTFHRLTSSHALYEYEGKMVMKGTTNVEGKYLDVSIYAGKFYHEVTPAETDSLSKSILNCYLNNVELNVPTVVTSDGGVILGSEDYARNSTVAEFVGGLE